MKQHRIDFIYKPLELVTSLAPYGSVSARQTYNAMGWDEELQAFREMYLPDYTLSPLTLLPQIAIVDADGKLPSGNVNAQLTNMTWTEIVGGTRTQITASTEGYLITESGEQKGMLAISKNIAPGTEITYEFQASYLDTRTGQVLTKIMSYIVSCVDETAEYPVLVLDSPEQKLYNPFTDADEQVITANLMLNGVDIPAANRVFVWEELRATDTWSEVGTDNADSDVTVSEDTTTLTLNRRLMGDAISIRCRARYDPTGESPSTAELNKLSPTAFTTVRRWIPAYDEDFVGVPANIPPGTEYLYPTAKVKVTNGELTNWEEELVARWYMATNVTSGTPTYVQVGEDESPEIPTTLMDDMLGGILSLDVTDRGAWGAWSDASGIALTDADGAVLMFH